MSFNLSNLAKKRNGSDSEVEEFEKRIKFGYTESNEPSNSKPINKKHLSQSEKDELSKKRKNDLIEQSYENVNSEKSKDSHKQFTLPGGYTIKRILDETPLELTQKIRRYMDVLYGTIYYCTGLTEHIIEIIPYVVRNILNYNNLEFSNVLYEKFNEECVEPIWYKYDIDSSTLKLFLFEPSIKQYCVNFKNLDVIYTCGVIQLQQFNPYKSICEDKEFTQDKQSINQCIALCDHIGQHIVNSLWHDFNEEPLPDTADLHYQFTKYGTTLHSMFELTAISNKKQDLSSSMLIDNSFIGNIYHKPNFVVE